MTESFTTHPNFPNHIQQPLGDLRELTRREWDIILLLARGYDTSQIAVNICIEPKSVNNYRRRISVKLGLKGRNKLAWYCWTNKETLENWHKFLYRS
jgi:DNA-binding NarL/FixJ family response regulator